MKNSVPKPETPASAIQGFSIQNSQAVKGIAILLLLFHHLFSGQGKADGIPVVIAPFSSEAFYTFGYFAKICIPLFVFITAYGLTVKLKEQLPEKKALQNIALKRYISLIIPFVFVYLLAFLACQLIPWSERGYSEVYGTGIKSLFFMVIDMFGLAECFHTPTLNPTWWYMSLAFLLIFTIPILWVIYRKVGIILLPAFFIFFRRVGWDSLFLIGILIAVLGIVVSETQFFERVHKCTEKKHILRVGIIPLCCILFVLCFLLYEAKIGKFRDIIYLTVVISVVLFEKECIALCKPIELFFVFLGKHSMNMFFIHTLIKSYFLHDFIYSFKYWWLIMIVFVVITLVFSILIDLLKKLLKINSLQSKIIKRVTR